MKEWTVQATITVELRMVAANDNQLEERADDTLDDAALVLEDRLNSSVPKYVTVVESVEHSIDDWEEYEG